MTEHGVVATHSAVIERAREARLLAERASEASALALDTEGDGMFRYRARLCTLQLATAREIGIVDTLAVDVTELADLLGPAGPEKVVHDAAFDARLLFSQGVMLGSVFDTAVAARFLGFTATGLSSLLLNLFGVELPKHKQQADWGARPLDAEAIAYLENDVRYLLPLREALLAQVRARDIEPEVREECAYVLAEAQREAPEPSPFSRVKGAGQRPPKQRARLFELALVRDEVARELDVPPGRVLANELMLRLADLGELPEAELGRRLSSTARPHTARFAHALAAASERADAPSEELIDDSRVPPASELIARKRRRELLTNFRAREAASRGVDPQVVLPGHCLTDLAKAPSLARETLLEVPGLGACRIERYGRRWAQELGPEW